QKRREVADGLQRTTHRRMEILALILALEALRYPCAVTICTEAPSVVTGITKGWAARWRGGGATGQGGTRPPDADLWGRLLGKCLQPLDGGDRLDGGTDLFRGRAETPRPEMQQNGTRFLQAPRAQPFLASLPQDGRSGMRGRGSSPTGSIARTGRRRQRRRR